jgi:hypothetical protein
MYKLSSTLAQQSARYRALNVLANFLTPFKCDLVTWEVPSLGVKVQESGTNGGCDGKVNVPEVPFFYDLLSQEIL